MKDTPCWDLFLQRVYKREERKTSKKNTMIKSCGGIAGCIYTNPSSQNQLTPPQFPVRKHRGKKGGENAQVCLYIHATAASVFVVSSLFIIPTFIFLFYSRWLVVRLLKPAYAMCPKGSFSGLLVFKGESIRLREFGRHSCFIPPFLWGIIAEQTHSKSSIK